MVPRGGRLAERRTLPESRQCIDCGRNTAPGIKNRAQTEQAFQILKLMGQEDEGVSMELNDQSEVYHVREAVWKAAGTAPFDGCLCIGCHPFNRAPGTKPSGVCKSCSPSHVW